MILFFFFFLLHCTWMNLCNNWKSRRTARLQEYQIPILLYIAMWLRCDRHFYKLKYSRYSLREIVDLFTAFNHYTVYLMRFKTVRLIRFDWRVKRKKDTNVCRYRAILNISSTYWESVRSSSVAKEKNDVIVETVYRVFNFRKRSWILLFLI